MARLSSRSLQIPQHEADSTVRVDHLSQLCVVHNKSTLYTFPLPMPLDATEKFLDSRSDTEATKVITDLPQGNVMGVKFSPDLAYMIIQRSATDLEIHVVKNGGQSSVSVSSTLSVSSSKSEREILAGGWWWVGDPQKRSPLGSLLLATTTGVEMYKIGPQEVATGSYKPVFAEKFDARWCRFEPIKQVLLVATGKLANMLRVYKFKANGSAAGGSNFKAGVQGAKELLPYPPTEVELPRMAKGSTPEPLSQDDIAIVSLYSSSYILRMDKLERKVYLHAVGNAARPLEIVLFHKSYDLHFTILDNVLILHDVVMKASMMYDIKLSVNCPVIPPCAIFPPSNAANKGVPDASADAKLSFPQPYYILDQENGVVHHMRLDFDEVVHMSTNKVWLMEFLLRRRGSKRWVCALLLDSMIAGEALATVAKLLKLVNAFYHFIYYRIQRRAPEHESDAWETPTDRLQGANGKGKTEVAAAPAATGIALSIMDDHFSTGSAEKPDDKADNKAQATSSGGNATKPSGGAPPSENEDPVITQVEFYHFILLPLQDGLDQKVRLLIDPNKPAVKGNTPRGTSYLVAVLLEYIRSLHEHGIKVHHCFYCAVISTLTQCQPPCYYQLHQLLQYHVLDDSIYVAMQVLGLKGIYPPAGQQGLDMLHRLGMHNDVVEVLLAEGKVLEGLKYAARNPTITVPTQRYIEAARTTRDSSTMMAVASFLERQGKIDAN